MYLTVFGSSLPIGLPLTCEATPTYSITAENAKSYKLVNVVAA